MKRVGRLMLFFVGLIALMTKLSTQSQDMQKVSFDRLYPDSCLKTSIETAMQVWGDLDLIAKRQDEAGEYIAVFSVDLSIGRLFKIKQCIAQIATRDGQVHEQDLDYLAAVLNKIRNTAHKLKERYHVSGQDVRAISCLVTLIEKLHEKLQ